MDWSRIKTIFIITFLLLDIFLGYEVYKKISGNELELIAETSIEEKLEADEIEYVELPKETLKETYISAQSKLFTEEETKTLKSQKVSLLNSTTIYSELENPVGIPDKNQSNFYEQFIKEYVYEGQNYRYWKTDKEERIIYLFQKYKDKFIYYNKSAVVSLKYNEENEIISYTQSMLDNIAEMDSPTQKQEILSAIKALEILYEKNEIQSKSKVTKVELGYMKLIPEEMDVQVLAPTWKFEINNESSVYVNAIEGQVIRSLIANGVKVK